MLNSNLAEHVWILSPSSRDDLSHDRAEGLKQVGAQFRLRWVPQDQLYVLCISSLGGHDEECFAARADFAGEDRANLVCPSPREQISWALGPVVVHRREA